MQSKRRILMVARDAGPAQHLVEIALRLRDSGLYDLVIHAQQPADGYFKAAGLEMQSISTPHARHDDQAAKTRLDATARDILTCKPDMVLCGFSTTYDSSGIDEAIASAFTGPVMVMQDAAGEILSIPNTANHHYLCLDEDALAKTTAKGARGTVIGPAKLEAFRRKDYAAAAAEFRALYGSQLYNRPVVTFCGQYLTEADNFTEARPYENILHEFAQAAAGANAFVVYRPHPRERVREDAWEKAVKEDAHLASNLPHDTSTTMSIFKQYLLDNVAIEPEGLSQDISLAGSDAVVSYCSGSLIDLVYMNHFSASALATPVALMWDHAYNEKLGVTPFAQMDHGRGCVVTNPTKLRDILERSADDAFRASHWSAARRLDIIDNAGDRTLEIIRRTMPRNYSRRAILTP